MTACHSRNGPLTLCVAEVPSRLPCLSPQPPPCFESLGFWYIADQFPLWCIHNITVLSFQSLSAPIRLNYLEVNSRRRPPSAPPSHDTLFDPLRPAYFEHTTAYGHFLAGSFATPT